jgi:thymidylate synthase (FAD)
MPKVTLIDYTGKGHPDPLYAARLLAFTKNTRFSLTPGNWGAFRLSEPESNILDEMEYMAGTIPSSWEMVDLVFCIERMSRNTSLQLVRTRTGSYAMQSQRVTDMSEATWDTPKWTATKPTRNGVPGMFDRAMEEAVACYANEVAGGTPLEDARDLLPGGIHTNGIAKYNLRTLVELVQKRESLRVQGAYVDIVRQMKAETLRVWPWSSQFFENKYDKGLRMLEEVALTLDHETKIKIAKAIDLIKAS